jgi:hypothetical protein
MLMSGVSVVSGKGTVAKVNLWPGDRLVTTLTENRGKVPPSVASGGGKSDRYRSTSYIASPSGWFDLQKTNYFCECGFHSRLSARTCV